MNVDRPGKSEAFEEIWAFGASDEGFSRVLRRLFSRVQVQFEAPPTAATQCLCLSSPCLSICTWFHSVLIVWPPLLRPQNFFFFFFFREPNERRKKKKAFRLDCSDSLLQPPLFFPLFFLPLSLSLSLHSPSGRPVLAQSNPATGSEPEFDARNRMPFVSQACSEAHCTCHT